MIRIIFFDIDGTLRDEVYGIPKTVTTALKACHKKGIQLFLCTGRPFKMITEDVCHLNVHGIISGGGSHIMLGKTMLKNTFFPKIIPETALSYLKSLPYEPPFTFETENKIFMNKKASDYITKLNHKKWQDLSPWFIKKIQKKEKIICSDTIHDFNPKTDPVNKICLWAGEAIRKPLAEILGNNEIHFSQIGYSGELEYCEFIQKNNDKGHAIEEVCGILEIPKEERMAFGDSQNDIDMFKAVETAIVMETGDKKIFSYANSICESPMKNGIFLELKRRNLL